MVSDGSIYQLTPTEIARGYLVGSEEPPFESDVRAQTARDALEQVVLRGLQRQPCGVAFSGGRDSSLILAVAAHVARREGLPDPIPLTRRFPGVAESDESEWQELVVRHLRLGDWQRFEIGDELEVIGPYAQRHLCQLGVVWPAAIATTVPLLEAVRGGTLLDGEGGDDVLGFENHRIGPASYLLRTPRAIGRRSLPLAVRELAPAPVRYRLHRRQRESEAFAWLRSDVREAFIADLARDRAERPLSFSAAVRAVRHRRILRVGERNRAVLARMYQVDRVSPLLESVVVNAVAREGGVLGPGDRAAVLRQLAGDLLPATLISRRSKATFNRAYIGKRSRAFAENWDGLGVDTALVDPVGLRSAWLDEPPHFMTALLLQQAWLSTSRARQDR